MSELEHTLNLVKEVVAENPDASLPMVGVRVAYSKGSENGRSRGGEANKFGLTTTEILERSAVWEWAASIC
jgi:arginine decarboxylase-like protein